jgi:hypothetical protein
MCRLNRITVAALISLLAALLLGGCGSGNKEGASQSGSALFGGVATVGDTVCNQCHSSVVDPLTNETIISQYQNFSPHNQPGLGCESCHGGGAGHNGVGPIPFPLGGQTTAQVAQRCVTCHDGVQTLTVDGVATIAPPSNAPDFDASNHATGTPAHTSGLCVRCHTHEGAVLSDASGFTGDNGVLTNTAYGPPLWPNAFTGFKCETCHQHGGGLRIVKARDAATNGNVVLWNPDLSNRTSQFNLCTSCHNIYNYNKTRVIGSGSVASNTLIFSSGPHNTRWNRVVTSTHREKGMLNLLQIPFANMTTINSTQGTLITGYALRLTNSTDPNYRGPCFDCHGHEAKTNTGSTAPAAANATIHSDWAQSGHAGGLLTAKYAAGAGNLRTQAEVDTVTAAGVDSTTNSWSHYNWDDTSSRGDCQMCHTATGISNYLRTQTTDLTGYSSANNNYSHLIGWSATGGSNRQNELLYCWGCHKDAGTGALRNTTQAIFSFTDSNSQAIVVTDAGKSTACVVCHGGRGSAGAAILNDSARSSRFAGHHAPTAGILYSAKTHIGFEYPGQSYANPSFFAHDKIGVGANGAGPCASCHMGPATSDGKPSHTFSPVTEDNTGITAINNQALCNTCHTPGGQFEMTPAILEEESAGYAEGSTILNNYVGNVAGYTNYLNLAITGSNYNNTTAVPTNAYGAFQNGKLGGTLGGTFGGVVVAAVAGDEPCAYVHNRFYIKRLIFDGIDWMDNGVLDGHISIDATAYPNAALWFGAPAGTTGAFTATRP